MAGAGLDTALGVLERALSKGPFLAGKTFSIAEITFAPYFEYLTLTPAASKLVEHPRVAAWWSAISDRPTWRKTVGR